MATVRILPISVVQVEPTGVLPAYQRRGLAQVLLLTCMGRFGARAQAGHTPKPPTMFPPPRLC